MNIAVYKQCFFIKRVKFSVNYSLKKYIKKYVTIQVLVGNYFFFSKHNYVFIMFAVQLGHHTHMGEGVGIGGGLAGPLIPQVLNHLAHPDI